MTFVAKQEETMMNENLTTLPPNARRWLERSLATNEPIPNRYLNSQEGEIDIRGKWMPFTANTIYQREPVSFVWKALLKLMPVAWVIAEDGHDGEKGWGGSKLWGFVPMGALKDAEVFAMQVVRSLAELPWKPQFALALTDLEWADSGDNSFDVATVAGDEPISVRFELNGNGDIIRASSERYYDVPDGFVKVPWHYEFSDHKDFAGVRMPETAVATYEKQEGPWEYWRGKITSVKVEV
jgi:hypothetical protein